MRQRFGAAHAVTLAGMLWLVLQASCVARARADDGPSEVLWSEVPDTEFDGVWQMIIKANRANWQSIRDLNCSGSFSMVDLVQIPFEPSKPETTTVRIESVKRTMQGTFALALDLESGSLFSKYEPKQITYERVSDGLSREVTPESNARWTIQTGEHSLTLLPGELTGRHPGDPSAPNWSAYHSRIVRKQKPAEAMAAATYGDVIDPRILVWGRAVPIFQHWEDVAREIKSQGLAPFREQLRGSGGREVRLESGADGRQYRFTLELSAGRFVTLIDMSRGANMIRSTFGPLDRHEPVSETIVEYTAVDGVYLPQQHETITRDKATARVDYTRTLTFETRLLNEGIDPSTFTERAFHLRTGDRVIDEQRDEMHLVAEDGRLVTRDEFDQLYATGVPGYSAKKSRAAAAKAQPRGQTIVSGVPLAYVLVAGNVVFLVSLAAFIVLRRRWRRK